MMDGPRFNIVIYQDSNAKAPLLKWFDRVSLKARTRCLARLELLEREGHELRRPAAAYLRDGIYELRVRDHRANHRILYFFAGDRIVLSHGLTKQQARVPSREIERALAHKAWFIRDPRKHTYTAELK